MKIRSVAILLSGLFALFVADTALAANMAFRYRNAAGQLRTISTIAELNTAIPNLPDGTRSDAEAYTILSGYINGCQDTKDRVTGLSNDITVTVNSCTDTGLVPSQGSWSSGQSIQIQSSDAHRSRSTLAHEVAHSVMKEQFGGLNPTHALTQEQKYGLDEIHYTSEITTVRTAFSEGYAEYWGDKAGGGQEQLPSTGGYTLHQESSTVTGSYTRVAWSNVTDASDMWQSEYVNSRILMDLSTHVPDGANKIERLINDGFRENLRDFIFRWRNTYPDDSDTLARIVDIDTNFTMSDDSLRQMTGASDYITNDRANARTSYRNHDSNTSLGQAFPPADTGPGTTGAGATGTNTGDGTGTGLPAPGTDGTGKTQKTPALDPFR